MSDYRAHECMSTEIEPQQLPDSQEMVWNILRNNSSIAETAYTRTAGYQNEVKQAVKHRYDATLDVSSIREEVVEARRLGLLSEWANVDPNQ